MQGVGWQRERGGREQDGGVRALEDAELAPTRSLLRSLALVYFLLPRVSCGGASAARGEGLFPLSLRALLRGALALTEIERVYLALWHGVDGEEWRCGLEEGAQAGGRHAGRRAGKGRERKAPARPVGRGVEASEERKRGAGGARHTSGSRGRAGDG